MGENNSNISHDISRAVHDLRDKFKHGHHIIKILESQLETARQNISLLQGQIRLANETIENLKQQFNEADMTLAYLTDNYKGNNERRGDPGRQTIRETDDYSQGPVYVGRSDDHEGRRRSMDYDKHSPRTVLTKSIEGSIVESDQNERTKSPAAHDKSSFGQERPKSPYAQQLRQVLDALQDEDPRKINSSIGHETTREVAPTSQNQSQVCNCPECVPSNSSHRHYQTDSMARASSCGCDFTGNEVHYHEECSKHKPIARHNEDSPINRPSSRHVSHHENATTSHVTSVTPSSHQVEYSSQCTGPCCSGIDLSKGYKIVEKSPGMPHYIAPRSPRRQKQHEIRHDPHCQMVGHCEDKCRCHTFVNYAPYRYQVLESAPGLPQTIQPISPGVLSKKTKRYLPLAPGDEPPHLKYTKVKRIDGSKVAAQKTIQDFSKRRLQPYNPRWDLDLLIVPPPLPASELLSAFGLEQESNYQQHREHGSGDNCVSNENLALENRSYDSSMLKSKVINAGGTVIVLTESEPHTRSVVTHSLAGVDHIEAAQQVGSFYNHASFQDEPTKTHQQDDGKIASDAQEVQREKGNDVDDSMHSESNEHSIEHAELKMETSPGVFVTGKDQNSEVILVKSNDLAHSGLVLDKSTVDAGYSEAAFRLMPQVSIKTERNNNSYPKRTISTLVSRDGQEVLDETMIDGKSNLTSRYEKVLFQRNQDYSRVTSDEEYVLNNRAKGKVH